MKGISRRFSRGQQLKRFIVELRQSLRMTQEEFADALETSQKMVSVWELGTNVPRRPYLEKIGRLWNDNQIRR